MKGVLRLVFATVLLAAFAFGQSKPPDETTGDNPQTWATRFKAWTDWLTGHVNDQAIGSPSGVNDQVIVWVNGVGLGYKSITDCSGAGKAQNYTASTHAPGCITTLIDSTQTYANPAWITSLAWSKLTGVPSTFAPSAHASSHGSGQTDAVTIAESQVTNLVTDLAAKATIASPTFTGNPQAPTPTAGDNTQKLATTQYVQTAIANFTTAKRSLSGTGVAAKCIGGIAGSAFSLASPAPTATCEADNIQAYLAFSAGSLANVYDRLELPTDWTGVLKLTLSGYNSANTNAPTINAYFGCPGTTVTPFTFGSAQPVSLGISSANTRSVVTVDLSSAVPSCAAGAPLYWKLAITAGASTEFRLLSARLTE